MQTFHQLFTGCLIRTESDAVLLPSAPRDRGACVNVRGSGGGSGGGVEGEVVTVQRALLRSWTDRVVRFYASAALQLAGFSSASVALATTPPIIDKESASEARSRVNAALGALLSAREIPQTERALVATMAAREALALIEIDNPSSMDMKSVLEAMHTIA
jgi:hypothetical protein